jgi:hypothetical protein
MQRRHQKVIEEALHRAFRANSSNAVRCVARSVTAVRAPLSFCMKNASSISSNTRVEAPRTEWISVDIVRTRSWWPPERLPFVQRDIKSGYRSNAVSAETSVCSRLTGPSPTGTPWRSIYANYFVPPNYDSMIGKSSYMATPVNRRWHAEHATERWWRVTPTSRCTASSWWMPNGRWHHIHYLEEGCPSEPGEVFLRWSFRYFAACVNGFFVASMFELILLAPWVRWKPSATRWKRWMH